PIVASTELLAGSQLKHIFIQYIPINRFTFFERYRVEIAQMELSEEVFEFYHTIRKQIDNASRVFHPPFFDLKGNVLVQSGQRKIMGTFAASTVARRFIYIPRSAVPHPLATELAPVDCRAVAPNASTSKPYYWF